MSIDSIDLERGFDFEAAGFSASENDEEVEDIRNDFLLSQLPPVTLAWLSACPEVADDCHLDRVCIDFERLLFWLIYAGYPNASFEYQ